MSNVEQLQQESQTLLAAVMRLRIQAAQVVANTLEATSAERLKTTAGMDMDLLGNRPSAALYLTIISVKH